MWLPHRVQFWCFIPQVWSCNIAAMSIYVQVFVFLLYNSDFLLTVVVRDMATVVKNKQKSLECRKVIKCRETPWLVSIFFRKWTERSSGGMVIWGSLSLVLRWPITAETTRHQYKQEVSANSFRRCPSETQRRWRESVQLLFFCFQWNSFSGLNWRKETQ